MSASNRTPSLSRRQLLTYAGALSSIAVLSACAAPMLVVQPETTVPEPQGEKPMNEPTKPTIVLVHGAFAESSSWEDVIRLLQSQGYPTIAAANPLRSLAGDGAFVGSILESIEGPIVLVGHSYGGSVITSAVGNHANVKALVYVAGFAPAVGENAIELSGRFPGSTLGESLRPVPLADGSADLYIQPDKFHHQFAADVDPAKTALMAATQRPVRDAALAEPFAGTPAWQVVPSWFVVPDLDLNIPPAVQLFMADRAQAQAVVEIKGASHAVGVSHPQAVADLIQRAATSVATAKVTVTDHEYAG